MSWTRPTTLSGATTLGQTLVDNVNVGFPPLSITGADMLDFVPRRSAIRGSAFGGMVPTAATALLFIKAALTRRDGEVSYESSGL